MSAEIWFGLQKALFSRLKAILDGSGVGVYDHVPEDDQAMPYITIDHHERLRRDSYDAEGAQHSIWLTIWSDYRGMKEVSEIIGKAAAGLHRSRLVIGEGENARQGVVTVSGETIRTDADGLTYIGQLVVEVEIPY